MHRAVFALPVLALFTISGAAGLVVEAVLLRQLIWLVGSSAAATAIVLAAFMAGLALGAVLFGRIADRSSRPLSMFGALEIATAVSCASLAWLCGSGRDLVIGPLRALGPGMVQQVAAPAVAFLLVLVPASLMGGTLPALSRLLIGELSRFGVSLGLLYGTNTLGGAAGVFAAGFYLFESRGIAASAYIAAAAQIAVGATALVLDRATHRGGAAPRLPPPRDRSVPDPGAADARTRAACLVAAAAGGGLMLGYEVVWTRLLSLPMRSFSYSFSLMLALFLVGIAAGAVAAPAWARRGASWAGLVGGLQVATAVYVAVSLWWLPRVLAPAEGASSFAGFLAAAVARAAPVVLPPTFLSGMMLPLAARGFAAGAGRVGADVGGVYAANTAGAIVGSLVTGLVLLPALGAPATLALLALVHAATGATVLLVGSRRVLYAALAWSLTAACGLSLAQADERFVAAFLRAARSSDQIGELLFFHESATDTIAIVRKDYGFHDPEAKSLITNGVAMSATVKPVWRYMAIEGHLPVLFARGKDRVFALGVGTGITLGAIASHGEVVAIDAAELSRGVVLGLPWFAAENGRAYDDPRVRLAIADGRHRLELSATRYDAITLEPPPPIVAGSVHLYSAEFYRLCLARLEPGGAVAQWLPLHSQSLLSARMTARTFLDSFPYVALWLPSARDAVLVGSAAPLRLGLDTLLDAYREPRTRDNLERAYFETPEALLGTYFLDREGLERWAGDAPAITDERPRMEFFRGQGGNLGERDLAELIGLPQPDFGWVDGIDGAPELLRKVELENRALRHYVRARVLGDPGEGATAAALARGTEFFLYGFGCAREQLAFLQASGAELRGQLARCARLRAAGFDAPKRPSAR